jgi:peptidoglycan hydrolase-like protein with peptidoglycan-binding domain
VAEVRRRPLFGAVAGQAVELLQEALRREGHDPGDLDGIYGFYTARAVRAFQKSHGLPPDGVVGRQTWELLGDVAGWSREQKSRYAGALHGAVQGPDVQAAQRTLGARGFDPGTVDGVFGPMTERAVLGFQEEHGLETTGVVDEATWAALGLPADAPRSWFPGYAADSIAGEDLLGIGERVDFLSSVLAAKRLETPLAIGIFGDWGSGKSFFMDAVRRRIEGITQRKPDDPATASQFCASIKQIEFNAWQYVQGNLWASLLEHILKNLDGAPLPRIEARRAEVASELAGVWADQKAQERRYEELVEQLREQVDTLATAKETRAAQLAQAEEEHAEALKEIISARRAVTDVLGKQRADLVGERADELLTALEEARAEAARGRAAHRVGACREDRPPAGGRGARRTVRARSDRDHTPADGDELEPQAAGRRREGACRSCRPSGAPRRGRRDSTRRGRPDGG